MYISRYPRLNFSKTYIAVSSTGSFSDAVILYQYMLMWSGILLKDIHRLSGDNSCLIF